MKIDQTHSHLLPNYSFISSDSEDETKDDILLFGDPIVDNDLSSEDNN